MTARTPRPAVRSRPLPSLAAALALGTIALGATHCRPPLCVEPASEPVGPQTLRDEVLAPFRCERPSQPRPQPEIASIGGGEIAQVSPTPIPPPPPPETPRMHPRGAERPVQPVPLPPPPATHPHVAGRIAHVTPHPIGN